MGNTIAKLIGNDPGDAIENLLSGANRVLTLSSNLRLDRDSRFSQYLNILGVVTTMGWAARAGYEFYRDLREDRTEYTIKIPQDGTMFEIAQQLAMEAVPDVDKTNIVARALYDGEKSYINTIFDSDLEQEVVVRGHKVIISTSVYEDESKDKDNSDHPAIGRSRKRKASGYSRSDLYITCRSLVARDAVLAELESRISVVTRRDSRLFLARDYGSFSSTGMSKRAPESVILREGQMDRVLKHFEIFLNNEEAYADLGIPYHTGILLHGPPGTGKTSITSVLSEKFGMDVYHIALNSVDGDSALFELFSEIPDRSIVLFEDVDISPSASDRDSDERERVTMSGLLNVLDGNLSPHGMIAILTTNHLDSLDPAIIRPGRVDLTENFSYIDQEQLERTCKYFMGFVPKDLPQITVAHKVSSADIVGVFRSDILDIPATEGELIKFLQKKTKKLAKKEKKAKTPEILPELVIPKELVA